MLEHLKKIPWEVWVGLGLTVLVAWWTTRSSVSAGQATAQGVIAAQAGTGPGTSSGLGQELGTLQAQMVTSIGDVQRQQTAIANSIGTPNDVTAGNQSSLFGAIGASNAGTAAGLANINTAVSHVGTQVNDVGTQVSGLGSTIANGQAAAAAQATANTQTIIGSGNSNAQGVQADIQQLFYAVPNRYTRYMSPGVVNPGAEWANVGP